MLWWNRMEEVKVVKHVNTKIQADLGTCMTTELKPSGEQDTVKAHQMGCCNASYSCWYSLLTQDFLAYICLHLGKLSPLYADVCRSMPNYLLSVPIFSGKFWSVLFYKISVDVHSRQTSEIMISPRRVSHAYFINSNEAFLAQTHLTKYVFLPLPTLPCRPAECPSLLQTISCNFTMVKMLY